ncbi:MAPEG family protein [Ferrimonas gelatinilytica]|uniref:MAPEG family protein n=1 Tax=Ferrimonas gelatinilytica TaxID=1255257 RepID=A0ABP9S0W4_9GAMM
MPTVVLVLLLLALLPYLLAAYGGYYKQRQLGGLDMHHPRLQDAGLSDRAHRISASQRNAWEALGFFVACVLAAHMRDASLEALASAALLFLLTRILHPLFYIGDLPPARSLTVVFGLLCGLYIGAWAG